MPLVIHHYMFCHLLAQPEHCASKIFLSRGQTKSTMSLMLTVHAVRSALSPLEIGGSDSSVKVSNPSCDFHERGRNELFDRMICSFIKTAAGRAARTRKISDKIKSSKLSR